MKKSFLNFPVPPMTVIIEIDTEERALDIVKCAIPEGAEAFGLQTCSLLPEYRNEKTYRTIFEAMGDKPIYVTNYRKRSNLGRPDEELAEELVELAKCGGTLIDVMGDMFDLQPDEMARDKDALARQRELIGRIHDAGGEVLMSSHIKKYTPAERILEMARLHQEQGADICKIVSGATTPAEEIENLRITDLLRQELKIPFLYLSTGRNTKVLRRVGPMFGSCMFLCVQRHTEYSTKEQPLLKELKLVRDHFDFF